MATFLYRLFSEDQKLLYIGISDNVEMRMYQHKKYKPWFHEVKTYTLERFMDRRSALEMEALAIYDEQPKHNLTTSHMKCGVYLDYLRKKR